MHIERDTGLELEWVLNIEDGREDHGNGLFAIFLEFNLFEVLRVLKRVHAIDLEVQVCLGDLSREGREK